MQTHTTDIMIIGGGASGLAAAVAAKQLHPEISVTVIERNPKVGKKILATGNGRCNLGNTSEDIKHYHGSCSAYWRKISSCTLTPEAFFQSMGLYCRQENDGRLYPYSNQASSVLDALRFTAEQLGVEMICDQVVLALQKEKDMFSATTENGTYFAPVAIVTPGGRAAPKTGSNGSSFSWLKRMGHSIVPQKPALVPFYTDLQQLKLLKGIRLAAKVTALSENGKVLSSDTGEVQFTDRTISGICVMNLSAACTKEEPTNISLRLLPQIPEERIQPLLWELFAIRAEWELENWLTGLLPKKAGMQLLRSSGIALPFQAKVYEITPQCMEQIVVTMLSWNFPVLSRGNWQDAQVTSGGVSSSEIDTNLQSRIVKGLFFAGEVLDFHGDCGGYNLNWAWQSGQFAGINAAKLVEQKRGETSD